MLGRDVNVPYYLPVDHRSIQILRTSLPPSNCFSPKCSWPAANKVFKNMAWECLAERSPFVIERCFFVNALCIAGVATKIVYIGQLVIV